MRGLKCVWLGGAVPTESLLLKINEYLCRDVVCVYASTEAHVAAFGYWSQIKHVQRAVGYVCPWATIECVDARAIRAAARPGGRHPDQDAKPGTLLFGIGEDPDDQIETWFYPGDRGMVTPDGMLVIEGRATDTINKGGVKLSAAIVDQCLAAVAGVQDAAVCSIQGHGDVEEMVALVVSSQPIGLAVLNAALQRAQIEATIDHAVTTEKIPRNETGKVNRDELRLSRAAASARDRYSASSRVRSISKSAMVSNALNCCLRS